MGLEDTPTNRSRHYKGNPCFKDELAEDLSELLLRSLCAQGFPSFIERKIGCCLSDQGVSLERV